MTSTLETNPCGGAARASARFGSGTRRASRAACKRSGGSRGAAGGKRRPAQVMQCHDSKFDYMSLQPIQLLAMTFNSPGSRNFSLLFSCSRTDVAGWQKPIVPMRVYPSHPSHPSHPSPITHHPGLLSPAPAVSVCGPMESMTHRRGDCTAVSLSCSCVWLFHSPFWFASAPCPRLEYQHVARASTFPSLAGLLTNPAKADTDIVPTAGFALVCDGGRCGTSMLWSLSRRPKSLRAYCTLTHGGQGEIVIRAQAKACKGAVLCRAAARDGVSNLYPGGTIAHHRYRVHRSRLTVQTTTHGQHDLLPLQKVMIHHPRPLPPSMPSFLTI
jgi:hypothetical protein